MTKHPVLEHIIILRIPGGHLSHPRILNARLPLSQTPSFNALCGPVVCSLIRGEFVLNVDTRYAAVEPHAGEWQLLQLVVCSTESS